jgi:RNA polymerase primary sigma factor
MDRRPGAAGPRGRVAHRPSGSVKAIAVESGLQLYLRQINKAPLLTADDERRLASSIRRAQRKAEQFNRGQCTLAEREDAEREAAVAREQMVKSNLRLVVNIAKKYGKRGMPLNDLINEGNLGLMRAVEGFDPAQNTRFSTYASWWIKQAIKRSLINSVQPIHIPAYMVEMIARWRQAQDAFMEEQGRQPSIQELAAHMKLPERKVRIIRRAVKAFTSPTQSADDESGLSLPELLADEKTPPPDKAMFTEAEAAMIQKMLDSISEREAAILRMRFGLGDGEPMTLKDIGKQIGLTRERVRQIEGEALRKLNELINSQL